MWSILASILAVSAQFAVATDVPVYCRVLQVGLEAASYQPILADVNMSVVEHITGLGDIDVSMSHLEIGAVKMVECSASVDANGVFTVGFKRMDIEIKKLMWQYKQRSFPHARDNGVASGNTSASFNVQVDTSKEVDHLFTFHLDQINLKMGSEHHPWLMAVLTKMLGFTRPLVSAVVQHESKLVMHNTLDLIRKDGGCMFLEGMLKEVDFVKFSFTSYEPTKVHVPLLGDVDVSVNSTYIHQPTSMQCQHVGFSGRMLTLHIEQVPFDTGFTWSYRKPGSSFWHNEGSGTANVVAGTLVHIDLLKPLDTQLKVDLPTLKVNLAAKSDKWMYKAVSHTVIPLIREGLQLFGGRVLTREIEKCLADPTCPQVKQLEKTTSEIVVV